MTERGEGLTQPHRRRIGWRLATGVATVALFAGCSDTDVDVSAQDFFPRSETAAADHETNPELRGRIDSKAVSAAETAVRLAGDNFTSGSSKLHYYVGSPDDTFSVSLRLGGDVSEISDETIRRLYIVRYREDENGQTIQAVDFDGNTTEEITLQMWSEDEDFSFDPSHSGDAEQVDRALSGVDRFLADLEAAAQVARG